MKNYERKQKKISLSLSLSEAIEHAPFVLYALIDKKKSRFDGERKKSRTAGFATVATSKNEKERHRWQHLSHIQTRLFSSPLRVTSFFLRLPHCETGFSTKFQNSQFPQRIIQTRYQITLQTSLAKMHNCQKPKILYPLYSTQNQLHMKLQPTAHETVQLSVNSQQVTKGLFTSPSPSPATNWFVEEKKNE